ncbi:MAG: FG-GAP repeat protein, partial [Myxococcales bacterium]|nr:FG-GAP repeat protein [Myxococcales bacterium]
MNGDSAPDILVGPPLDSNNGSESGSATIYSGSDGLAIFNIDGAAAKYALGMSVGGIDDVDGDQIADFIIGVPFDDSPSANGGTASVYSGQTKTVLFTASATADEDHLGWSVSSAGDVNGDDVPDFVVGAPEDATFSPKREGYAKVFSGATGGLLFTFDGDANGDYFGWSVSSAGDVNRDGHDDVIVGADQFASGPGAGGTGYARVFSGLDGALLYHLTGDAAGDRFGSAVAGVEDVNGDGFDDFAVGAPRTQSGTSGYVRVFSGATGAVLHEFVGFGDGDRFGIALAAAGDLDGD